MRRKAAPGDARRYSAAPRRGEDNDKGERLCKTIMQGRKPLHYFSERFLFVLSKRNPSDSKEKTALVLVGG